MSQERKLQKSRKRRTLRVRAKVRNTGLPRVSVFRSLNHMYAQIIDDAAQKTLLSCSSLELETKPAGDKKAVAFAVGRQLAERARGAGIASVVFDRGRFLYHGRVKSLADGLREGGLNV